MPKISHYASLKQLEKLQQEIENAVAHQEKSIKEVEDGLKEARGILIGMHDTLSKIKWRIYELKEEEKNSE